MLFTFELAVLMAILWVASIGCYTCVRLAIWNGDPPRWLSTAQVSLTCELMLPSPTRRDHPISAAASCSHSTE